MNEHDSGLDQPWNEWTDHRPAFAEIHLDTAAAGRMSVAVQRAVNDHLTRESEVGAYVAEDEAATAIADDHSGRHPTSTESGAISPEFYCTVDRHKMKGMDLTIKVT